ncbi:MAG: PepSY-associated TM helix domain-containing protein, partial [Verrucomicrobia bacterium]|nr:PepSY-associated TM helix domain-containing protein [Verrucomicrobiota bacterium]
EGYDHKAGLFLTLWELHSGELFGLVGMLFVDILGIVLIFLSLTGLLHFLFPKWMSRLKKQGRSYASPLSYKKWNLKWHNRIGYIFVVFLLVNTTAGMFLRPPLLIPIASSQIGILPHTHMDTNNPWHDKLRRIIWNSRMSWPIRGGPRLPLTLPQTMRPRSPIRTPRSRIASIASASVERITHHGSRITHHALSFIAPFPPA